MWPNNVYKEDDYCILRKKGRILSQKQAWDAITKVCQKEDEIINILKDSGLTGRGGAGFPLGLKWESVKNASAKEKIIVCNASEGEPGTAANRILFEENPDAVLAGLCVCAKVVGAQKAYIYLRKEYWKYADCIQQIIEVHRSDFDGTQVILFKEPGGYVCGEETALLETLEGNRGEPRLKPPYPTVEGAFGKPTVINNVESFANVPFIINEGIEAFRSMGTEKTPGTKLYTISGPVKEPGVYELPVGVTLQELLIACGGLKAGKLKGMQIGGASGLFLKEDSLSRVFAPNEEGISFGVGDVRFIEGEESIPEIVLELVDFFAEESCGVCIPCKYGLSDLRNKMKTLFNLGQTPEKYDDIKEACTHINKSARCAMGQAASGCLISALTMYEEEFRDLTEGRMLF